jgi:transglutaminase-like putative cysteine protease
MDDWNLRGYREGDCDDISTFIASVCRALGIAVRFVAIRTDPLDYEFKHVFCEVAPDGTWTGFDATVPAGTTMIYYGEPMIQSV